MYEIWIKGDFSAAHHLRKYEGKCENPHGHNWTVEVLLICEELNSIGLGMDFREVKQRLAKVLEKLDHKDLNQLPQFEKENPSSENIAHFIYDQLKEEFTSDEVKLSKVKVYESPSSGVSYWEDRE